MDESGCGSRNHLRTRQAVRDHLEAHGQTVTAWARSNGFTREQVYAFLAGRTKGKRGISHRLAIALRVKAAPADDPEAPPENPKLLSSAG